MGRCRANRRNRRPLIAGALAAVVASMFTAQGLVAQQPTEERGEISGIEPGARVRITTASSRPALGWVDALEPRGIRLVEERDHTVVTIPHDAIRRIERSRVRRSDARRAVPGLIAGGLLGLVIGVVTTENAEDVDCDPRSPFCFDLDLPSNKVMAGFAGLGIGMIAGGLISGAIVPGESWEDASLPALTAGADARGAYLALRIPLGLRRRQ